MSTYNRNLITKLSQHQGIAFFFTIALTQNKALDFNRNYFLSQSIFHCIKVLLYSSKLFLIQNPELILDMIIASCIRVLVLISKYQFVLQTHSFFRIKYKLLILASFFESKYCFLYLSIASLFTIALLLRLGISL